jgi:DNA-binding response OmpR family regulator
VPPTSDLKTILVLDDDPHFHKLVVPFLIGRGHKVLSAHSGKQASELMTSEKEVDLVIVDGQLPDANGLDWIAALRASGNRSLVMFVSAYWRDAQSYHKLTKELAVSLVLHKPVMPSVFAAEVDLLLGKTSALGDGTKSDLEDTLLALRAEYARELPARLAELQGLVVEMKAHPDNHFLVHEARVHAHKLRGTASSYGFKQLGDLAAALEETLIEAQRKGDRQASFYEQIDNYIEQALEIAAEAAQQADHKLSDPVSELAAGGDVRPPSATARILVVDDDAAFLDLIEEVAAKHELEIVRASNASEALDMACLQPIDAALIDVELGSKEAAFRLATELRALPEYQDMPLGFVSGAGHIEESAEASNVGHYLFVDRVLRADALEAALRNLTAIKQAVRPRILIIDDDSDFLQRTAFVLRHEGMQVDTLEDTADVLGRMQQFLPDLILLDVMMPGVSGFDICRILRTMPRWRDLPILFLTAYADIDTRIACLRCGGDDCLVKPVVNEELLVRVRTRLEKTRSLKQRLEKDNVSGLLNRRAFMAQLKGALGEAHRHNWSITVAMVRVVGLSGCSEQSGADGILAAAGNLLSKRLRTEDLKGNWSDSRLIVAFREEEHAFVDGLLQKIASEFAATQAVQHEKCATRPALAYALSCYPDDGTAIHQLLLAADHRLTQQRPVSAGRGS